MKEKLLDLLKGICIGIANVIPGFSGGTMAVILNVYEKFINGLGQLFSHPIKALKDIWAILVGLIVGIILSVVSITKLLELFPIPTVLFFVGLIIGSIPGIFNSYKANGKTKVIDIILLIIAMAVIIGMPFISGKSINVEGINIGIIIIMFIMGIICAAAMILPGVSGSLTLMAFGYYIFLMDEISSILHGIVKWNFNGLLEPFLVIVAFGIGAILGLVFVSKLLSILFKKFPRTVYAVILGLLLASPFAIIYSVIDEYKETCMATSPWGYVVGVLLLALGIFLAIYPAMYAKKKKLREEINKDIEE